MDDTDSLNTLIAFDLNADMGVNLRYGQSSV